MMKNLEGSMSLQALDILRYSLHVNQKAKADEFNQHFGIAFPNFLFFGANICKGKQQDKH